MALENTYLQLRMIELKLRFISIFPSNWSKYLEAVVAFLVRRLPLVGQPQDELLSDLGGRDEVVV